MKNLNALSALNTLEEGGKVLATMEGSFLSCVWEMTKGGQISRYNKALGVCVGDMSKAQTYEHFSNLLAEGAELFSIK